MNRSDMGRIGLERLEDRISPAGGGTITGVLWQDIDHDGLRETGDDPITFYHVVYLYSGSNVVAQTTAINGQYAFINIPNGTYSVQFELPDDWNLDENHQDDNDFVLNDVGRAYSGTFTVSASHQLHNFDAGLWLDS